MNNYKVDSRTMGADVDFTVVETASDLVVLDVHQWDESLGMHSSATLHMHPMEARLLAGQLFRHAAQVGTENR